MRVFDIDAGSPSLVRQFEGHTNRITDAAFSADGRWLVSAAMDSTIRVWDMPQGRCIDWFAVKKPVTSLSISPTRDFLATTHVEDVGIYMWSNRTQYQQVIMQKLPQAPRMADMPTASGALTGGGAAAAAADEGESDDEEEEEFELVATKLEQLTPELATLSDVPKAQWTVLPKLDTVRERNKPKLPPKKPEAAPFFLEQAWDGDKDTGKMQVPTRPRDCTHRTHRAR